LPRNGEFISINAPANASSVWKNDNSKFGVQLAVDGGMQT